MSLVCLLLLILVDLSMDQIFHDTQLGDEGAPDERRKFSFAVAFEAAAFLAWAAVAAM
eukprot:SAG11_NODE_22426_length_406_cov_0.889251_2_plen_57_part_01